MLYFFSTGIITEIGICIIHKNHSGSQWSTSLLLNIVIVSLNSNVQLSNKSMYFSFVKLC